MNQYLQSTLIENTYLFAILTLIITLYGPRLAPELPLSIKKLFNNTIFRTLLIFLLVLMAKKKMKIAIVIAVIYLVIQGMIDKDNALLMLFDKSIENEESHSGMDDAIHQQVTNSAAEHFLDKSSLRESLGFEHFTSDNKKEMREERKEEHHAAHEEHEKERAERKEEHHAAHEEHEQERAERKEDHHAAHEEHLQERAERKAEHHAAHEEHEEERAERDQELQEEFTNRTSSEQMNTLHSDLPGVDHNHGADIQSAHQQLNLPSQNNVQSEVNDAHIPDNMVRNDPYPNGPPVCDCSIYSPNSIQLTGTAFYPIGDNNTLQDMNLDSLETSQQFSNDKFSSSCLKTLSTQASQ